MGLDVYLVASMRRLNEEELAELEEDEPWGIDGDLPAPYQPGSYLVEQVASVRIGSYGGFNSWRESMAKMIGFERRDQVTESDTFGYLLDHSDCDGILIPHQVDQLVTDFRTHKERARSHLSEYHFVNYEEWLGLLERCQAIGGILIFS